HLSRAKSHFSFTTGDFSFTTSHFPFTTSHFSSRQVTFRLRQVTFRSRQVAFRSRQVAFRERQVTFRSRQATKGQRLGASLPRAASLPAHRVPRRLGAIQQTLVADRRRLKLEPKLAPVAQGQRYQLRRQVDRRPLPPRRHHPALRLERLVTLLAHGDVVLPVPVQRHLRRRAGHLLAVQVNQRPGRITLEAQR